MSEFLFFPLNPIFLFTAPDLVPRVDLPFRGAVNLLHSRRADIHQVEQPLLIRRLLWPVDLQGGGFRQALSQIYDLQIERRPEWRSRYSFHTNASVTESP